jgi:voltage-dependent anion channel protein 2
MSAAPVQMVAEMVQISHISVCLQFDLEYVHGLVGLKGSIGLKQSPVTEGSFAIGKEGILLGGEGAYDTSKGEVTKYSAGIQYSQPDFSAAAIL